MLVVSAVLLLAAVVAIAFVGRAVVGRERSLGRLDELLARHRAVADERARVAAARAEAATAADSGAALIVVPTEVTRRSHAAIAAIPFTVLDQIPATADTARVVRALHDEISAVVYDTISGTARGVAGILRGRRR